MSLSIWIFTLILLLAGLFCLTALSSAFRRLQRTNTTKQIHQNQRLFFYRTLHLLFFPQQEYEGLFFAITCAQNILRFCYALVSFFFMIHAGLIVVETDPTSSALLLSIDWSLGILYLLSLFTLFFLVGDYFPRLVGMHHPEIVISATSPLASVCLILSFPFIFIFTKFSHLFSRLFYFDRLQEPITQAKQDLLDLIEESDVSSGLDQHDTTLFESVMDFKNRIAREVMVPRVDVFSLPFNTTILEASTIIDNEGYSRIPVYKNTLDNIIGVLMYKDVLAKYIEYERKGNKNILQAPIGTLVKNVLYTPETKKISQLLQEFRKKQVHLAIVVDEYGGTEGIVTIEDILEEIVGDIADEYDDEQALFISVPEGGWIVDARMTISDIEEQLGIEIPQTGDYDTIGGYIFHQTGMIPIKGFTIKQDTFELEVLRSNNRHVEKIRIKAVDI